ncbi:MAG: pyridoxamine 5'-phosphate oxidase family protein, partial [Rhodospirillaceae bacterium]
MVSETMMAKVKADADKAVLCWLATVGTDGVPNVSPKQLWAVQGDGTVRIANIASPKTVANLAGNPWACLSFIDIFRQKGFKLVGQTQVIAADAPAFPDLVAPLAAWAGDRFPIKDVILLSVESIERIWAPS